VVRWRQTDGEASVREAPSDDLAKPRPLKGMSKELWALGDVPREVPNVGE
jgi:hypothetical protein